MNEDEIRLLDSIHILYSLFDIVPSPDHETQIFKGITHEDLCQALKYWIDQTKLFFGEVVQIQIIII